MRHHKDPTVDRAIVSLLDELCTWERNTGRENTIILIPHVPDEKIVMAQNGKPVPEDMEPGEILRFALTKRKKNS